jgi:hypothetical protein
MDQRTRYLNARAVLREAITHFETHDLLKTGHYYDESGNACTIGSLMLANQAIPEFKDLQELPEEDASSLVYLQFAKDHPRQSYLTHWSDKKATKEDVIKLLKRTLRNAKSLWVEANWRY